MTDLTPAQIEDREYYDVDLRMGIADRCGAVNADIGRTCSRRALHINERHRDGEMSWTQAMSDATSNEVLEARLARFEDILVRQPNHTHARIMVLALSNELAVRKPLDVRCLTHEIRACTICVPAGRV